MPSVSPFAALKSAFEPIATAPPPASAMGTAKSVMPNPVASEIPSTLRPPQNSFAARVPESAYPAAEIRNVRDSRDRRLRLDALRPDAGGTTAKSFYLIAGDPDKYLSVDFHDGRTTANLRAYLANDDSVTQHLAIFVDGRTIPLEATETKRMTEKKYPLNPDSREMIETGITAHYFDNLVFFQPEATGEQPTEVAFVINGDVAMVRLYFKNDESRRQWEAPPAPQTPAKLPATSPLDGLSAPTPKTDEGKIASKALEDAIAYFAQEPGAKKFFAGAGMGIHDNGPMGTSSYLMGYADKAKVERAAEMLSAYLGAQRPGIHVTVEQGSQITGQFDTESSVYFLKFSVSNTTESW